MNSDREYLLDAIQIFSHILEFTQGLNQDEFEID